MAERAGAYWLIDEIALAKKAEAKLASEEFQVWTLVVEGSSALLRWDDGNDRLLLERRIEYTDFPEPGIKFYVVDSVIILPGEYWADILSSSGRSASNCLPIDVDSCEAIVLVAEHGLAARGVAAGLRNCRLEALPI